MPISDIAAILDSLSDPAILVDQRGRIVLTNKAASDQFGSGLGGQYFARAVREPEALSCVERVLRGQPQSEALIHRRLPVRATLKVRAVKLAPLENIEAAALVTVTDVSYIYEAEQMRSDFVANVSHELRSPLTSVTSIIETLKESARDDANARDHFLSIMEREAGRMNRLIDDLLSLSSVEVNAHIRPTGLVEMTKLIKQVVNTIDTRDGRSTSNIALNLPQGPINVSGDEDELIQVFHNLIENSLKYAGDESPIKITVRTDDKAPGFQIPVISIAVLDQGPGIAPEHIPRLTERFYRVDSSRSRLQGGGTGLGLAIVKHIVNRHRGRLLIESELDVGSTFTVTLPRAS